MSCRVLILIFGIFLAQGSVAVPALHEYECQSTSTLFKNDVRTVVLKSATFDLGYKNQMTLHGVLYTQALDGYKITIYANVAQVQRTGDSFWREQADLFLVDPVSSSGSVKTKAETTIDANDFNLPRNFSLRLKTNGELPDMKVEVELNCNVVDERLL